MSDMDKREARTDLDVGEMVLELVNTLEINRINFCLPGALVDDKQEGAITYVSGTKMKGGNR
jgi:hypothetical protein